jgi:Fe-S-cluster containining protein
MIETEGEISGPRLTPGEELPFRCHPGLACFNTCCRNKRLTLLPYDALRLARGLGCRSDELLAKHAELEIEPGSGWPTLRLRLEEDGRCPFVRDAGCAVYGDRPTCCRIFPLARAVRLEGRGGASETFFIAAEGSRCLGFGAKDGLTVEGWARDQGLDPYRAANNRVARLFLHPRRPRPLSLSPEEVHAVIMALYNLDVFRDFVARPGFGARSGLDGAAVERALASDEALLDLGQDWLEAQFFSAPF